ncbi:MAG: hypothetical protein H7831_12815 [Magnetococcus sp. WYHC-3]
MVRFPFVSGWATADPGSVRSIPWYPGHRWSSARRELLLSRGRHARPARFDRRAPWRTAAWKLKLLPSHRVLCNDYTSMTLQLRESSPTSRRIINPA